MCSYLPLNQVNPRSIQVIHDLLHLSSVITTVVLKKFIGDIIELTHTGVSLVQILY